MKQLTIDVGGTFTDCLVLDDAGQLQRFKASTTPDDPTQGFFAAVVKAAAHYGQSLDQFLGDVEQIIHGTTLGTNILITERGAKVGMITTKGFPRHRWRCAAASAICTARCSTCSSSPTSRWCRAICASASRSARSTPARSSRRSNESELRAAAQQAHR